MFIKVTVLALVSITTVSCHLCLVSPPQRGSMMGINKPAAPDCFLINGPCGGRKHPSKGLPSFAVAGGRNFTVTFQKNLDHWTENTPGYLSVSIGPEGGMMKEYAKIMDRGEPSLHLYSVNVTMPNVEGYHFTMQVMYKTNNPNAPAAFYQCTDFAIFSATRNANVAANNYL